jgi:malate dehydrogenase
MREDAIIGAGELAGELAHLLARADIALSVRLVDEAGHVAAGKALDIMQAAPIEGFTTRVSGTADLFSVGGSSLIVMADKAGPSGSIEWQADEGIRQLGRVQQLARDRIVVCAGASQRELVERGVLELSFSPARLFGSAPEALASALRAFVALEANASPRDVSLSVLGVPPHHVVVPWDQAAVAGRALTHLLDEPARRRLVARTAPLWPPGAHALAAAAVKVIACVEGRSREAVSCFVSSASTGEARQDHPERRAIALPVRLGAEGILAVAEPHLNAHDRVALDNARGNFRA